MFCVTFLWQWWFLLALFQVIKISQIHKTEILTLSDPVIQKTASVWEKQNVSCYFHVPYALWQAQSLCYQISIIFSPTTGLLSSSSPYGAAHLSSLSSFLCCFKIPKLQAQDALWTKLSSHSFLHISPATNLEAISLFKDQQAKFPKQPNPGRVAFISGAVTAAAWLIGLLLSFRREPSNEQHSLPLDAHCIPEACHHPRFYAGGTAN